MLSKLELLFDSLLPLSQGCNKYNNVILLLPLLHMLKEKEIKKKDWCKARKCQLQKGGNKAGEFCGKKIFLHSAVVCVQFLLHKVTNECVEIHEKIKYSYSV